MAYKVKSLVSLAFFILFVAHFSQLLALEGGANQEGLGQPKGLNQIAPSSRRKRADIGKTDGGLLGDTHTDFLGNSAPLTDSPTKDGLLDPQKYIVNAGDKLQISLVGGVAETIVVSVGPEGEVIIPKLGVFKVGGKSLSDVKDEILSKMARSFRNLEFSVTLLAPRVLRVFVLGEVNNPQAVSATPLTPLSEMITLAGNIKPTGSRQRVRVQDPNGAYKEYDLQRFLRDGDLSQNPTLVEGQTVFVPARGESVYVGGGVEYPGSYELGSTLRTLDDLIRVSRPMKARLAPSAEVRIQRQTDEGKQREIKIKFRDLMQQAPGFELISGDIVQYPFSVPGLAPVETDKVYVSGEVRAPGVFAYSAHMTYQDYIGLSGGLTQRANFKEAKIVKKNGVSYDLDEQVRLEPGDTLYVPEVTFKFWQDHLTVIGTLLTIFGSTVSIIQLTR